MAEEQMSFYVLIASEQMSNDGEVIPASTVLSALVARGKWFLTSYAPYRQVYHEGDRVIFYLAGRKHRYFAGTAIIADKAKPITASEEALLAKLGLYGFEYELQLDEIVVWDVPVPILQLVERLDFIKDKKNYGLNLRQAAARISSKDYNVIIYCHSS